MRDLFQAPPGRPLTYRVVAVNGKGEGRPGPGTSVGVSAIDKEP
jgi:hypothetical protein